MSDFRPYPKIQASFKQKQPLKAKHKPTGELALFKEIARIRPHVSFVSGERITDLKPIHFSHILGKGAYPEMRLESENIVLMTAEEHHLWHSIDRENLLKLNPNWQKVYDLAEKLKTKQHEKE